MYLTGLILSGGKYYKTLPKLHYLHPRRHPFPTVLPNTYPQDYAEEEIDADIPPVREPEPRSYDYDRYSRGSHSTPRGNVHPTFVKLLPTKYKVEVRPWTTVRPILYEPFYYVDLRGYQSEDSLL